MFFYFLKSRISEQGGDGFEFFFTSNKEKYKTGLVTLRCKVKIDAERTVNGPQHVGFDKSHDTDKWTKPFLPMHFS